MDLLQHIEDETYKLYRAEVQFQANISEKRRLSNVLKEQSNETRRRFSDSQQEQARVEQSFCTVEERLARKTDQFGDIENNLQIVTNIQEEQVKKAEEAQMIDLRTLIKDVVVIKKKRDENILAEKECENDLQKTLDELATNHTNLVTDYESHEKVFSESLFNVRSSILAVAEKLSEKNSIVDAKEAEENDRRKDADECEKYSNELDQEVTFQSQRQEILESNMIERKETLSESFSQLEIATKKGHEFEKASLDSQCEIEQLIEEMQLDGSKLTDLMVNWSLKVDFESIKRNLNDSLKLENDLKDQISTIDQMCGQTDVLINEITEYTLQEQELKSKLVRLENFKTQDDALTIELSEASNEIGKKSAQKEKIIEALKRGEKPEILLAKIESLTQEKLHKEQEINEICRKKHVLDEEMTSLKTEFDNIHEIIAMNDIADDIPTLKSKIKSISEMLTQVNNKITTEQKEIAEKERFEKSVTCELEKQHKASKQALSNKITTFEKKVRDLEKQLKMQESSKMDMEGKLKGFEKSLSLLKTTETSSTLATPRPLMKKTVYTPQSSNPGSVSRFSMQPSPIFQNKASIFEVLFF